MSNKEKNIDPRIKRTKRMFKEALISLIQENDDKSKLTVQHIADRAELNRATFYLHYQDIDDFMQQMIDDMLDELNRTMKFSSDENQSIRPKTRLISFLEHFYRNAGLYNVMLENQDFRKRVFDILLDIILLLFGTKIENQKGVCSKCQMRLLLLQRLASYRGGYKKEHLTVQAT